MLQIAIDDFAAPGTEVVFVSRWPPDDMPESTAKCSFRYLEGVPFDHEVCRRAGVGSCDSIIIGREGAPGAGCFRSWRK